MNSSLINVAETTTNRDVEKWANKLIDNRNKKCKITFRKANGDLRVMTTIPGHEWSQLTATPTTAAGRRGVQTKVKKNTITVAEIVMPGVFQPRSINLETVQKIEVI